MNRQHRIEEMGQPNALVFGDEAEEAAVAVETPRPAVFDNLNPCLVVAVEQFVRDFACWILVSQFEGLRAEPLDSDDANECVWQDTPDGGVRLQVFEFQRARPILIGPRLARGTNQPLADWSVRSRHAHDLHATKGCHGAIQRCFGLSDVCEPCWPALPR